mmetsp:Transcript_46276/g.106832  ORF Transcript_46276/g.106832 Transcript_46276/m.106832 type:complete len:309 (+) Transcript_46276:2989-3915(+)
MSTECGTHSTARASISLASSGDSRSIAACQSLTELGSTSSALRSTRRRSRSSSSSEAACSHTLTEVGTARTASARISLALPVPCSRAASSQTSSEPGQARQASFISPIALLILPATSSSRAEAIHAGACDGLVWRTESSSSRAFLMSPISASEDTLTEARSVRYPLGSTTVCPLTESPARSSLTESTELRARPSDLRSASGASVLAPLGPPSPGATIVSVSSCRLAPASSVSGALVKRSCRLAACAPLMCAPGSGSASHSAYETVSSSRFRSANWCCSFGRDARNFASSSCSRASRRALRRLSSCAST